MTVGVLFLPLALPFPLPFPFTILVVNKLKFQMEMRVVFFCYLNNFFLILVVLQSLEKIVCYEVN